MDGSRYISKFTDPLATTLDHEIGFVINAYVEHVLYQCSALLLALAYAMD